MVVAALLSDAFMARLVDAVRDLRGTVRPARDWAHLHELLTTAPVSVVVVDPLVGKINATDEVIRLLQLWPSIPIIAYSHLTSEGAKAFAALGRNGLREIVLYQYDDSRIRFSHLLRRASAHGIVARLRSGLYTRIATLPAGVANAVEDLLERPYAFQSGYDLVTASAAPRSTLHLHLQQAGLSPPRRLFVTARVAHAASYLRDRGLRIQDVAAKLGYYHPDTLAKHTLEILGVHPRQLRQPAATPALSDDEIVSRLLACAQQGGET